MNKVYKLLTSAEKHRKEVIDCAINGLKLEAETINTFIRNTEREWALLEEKLNKERLVALAALSKSKVLLTNMELQIAESELNKENQQNPSKLQRCESDDQVNMLPAEKKLRRPTKSSARRLRSPNSSRSRRNTRSQSNSIPNEESTVQANLKPNAEENDNIKCGNPVTQCSVSSTTPTYSNRDLSASIITEFVKPYAKIIDLPQKSIPTNKMVPIINKLPQKRKITPVLNVEVYNKPYSSSLSSHVLYNPMAHVKRPLHTGDPRTYYYKTDSKVKQPMMLPVPQMSRPVPTQTQKPGVYIPQCTPVQNKTASTTRKDQQPVNSELKKWQQEYLPTVNTRHYYGSTNSPIPFRPKQGLNNCSYSVNMSKKFENRHQPFNNITNVERKPVSNVTPPQINKREKHICVPTPPLYCKSRHLYSNNIENTN